MYETRGWRTESGTNGNLIKEDFLNFIDYTSLYSSPLAFALNTLGDKTLENVGTWKRWDLSFLTGHSKWLQAQIKTVERSGKKRTRFAKPKEASLRCEPRDRLRYVARKERFANASDFFRIWSKREISTVRWITINRGKKREYCGVAKEDIEGRWEGTKRVKCS